MNFEFDKEMDVLLRQAARAGEAEPVDSAAHLDADEIGAFAENVLPEKTRLRATRHLADCARCRKILSSSIAFNVAFISETVHAKGKVAAATSIPWYRKLFAFPQVVYAMGASALLFGGIIAVIFLRDSSQNTAPDVAQIERQNIAPASFSTPVPSSSVANSTAASANTNTMSNAANSAANVSTAASKPSLREDQSGALSNSNAAQNKATAANKNAEAENAKKEKRENDETIAVAAPLAKPAGQSPYTDNDQVRDADAARQSETSQNAVSQNQSTNAPQISSNTRSVQNLPMNGRQTSPMRMQKSAEADDKNIETKTVGGKAFRRTDGAWYDAEYRNQKTINLRRGTDEYKKLDASLRSIVDRLGGVVVIVSGGKAYRIQ